ncbi:MAG: MATE family efflux transporter, partial [Oscillospiraceae bacterium]|nr:MATE family efflux transporter [Oscillospiraceae bacterium]
MVLQNLITTSLGFIDTFMVGLLGSEEMSALTVANVPMFILQLVVFGLQSGSSVLISQYWGKGDRKSINRVLGIGIFVAGGISALAALVMCTAPQWVLYLITDNPRLVVLAMPYLRIVGVSYVFNALASIYIGMQRSTENPRFGMLVFASSTVFNTLGNYILIFGKLGF